mmetsp:Transcript_112025/g.210109  ORF Transcript_112025/g.210109 Transcript_112025/m.210109 type:complete len:267 (+) Transcript_112025:79-879(+)
MCTATRVERHVMVGSCDSKVLQAACVGHCSSHQVGELSDAETDIVLDAEAVDSGYSSPGDSGYLSTGDSGYSCDDEGEHADMHRCQRPVGRCTAQAPTALKKVSASMPRNRRSRKMDQSSKSQTAMPVDAQIADAYAVIGSETDDVDVDKWHGIGHRISSLLALSDDESASTSTKNSLMKIDKFSRAESTIAVDVKISGPLASHHDDTDDVDVDKWQSIGCRLSSLLALSDDEADKFCEAESAILHVKVSVPSASQHTEGQDSQAR